MKQKTPQEEVIPFAPLKVGKGQIIAWVATLLALVLALFPSSQIVQWPILNSPTLIHVMGWLVFVVGGLITLAHLSRRAQVRSGPALIFNKKGFTDNVSGVAAGFIPWSEVHALGKGQAGKQIILVVQVKNPEKYVEMGNKLQRTVNRANMKMAGSPITISSSLLPISADELEQKFVRWIKTTGMQMRR